MSSEVRRWASQMVEILALLMTVKLLLGVPQAVAS